MIRRYTHNDIKDIVKLESLTLGTTLGEDMLKSELDNPLSYIFVYSKDNEIIGYISTSFDGEIVEILNFCVNPNMQNKGIGSSLLEYIFDYFKNLNAKSSILEVRESNTKAISLYTKSGYNKISIRKSYYSNRENALVLQKIF